MKKISTVLILLITAVLVNGQELKKYLSDTVFIKNELWKKERLNYYLDNDEQMFPDFGAYYNRGLDKMKNRLYREAINDFKLSLEQEAHITENIPNLEKHHLENDAIFNIAACFTMLDQYDSALFYYRKIIKNNPYNTEAYIEVASLHQSSNDIKGAIETLEEAIEVNPESPELIYNLGVAYLYKGRLGKTKQIQKQLMEQFPSYEESYFLLAVIYLYEQRNHQAGKTLDKAIEINPDYKLAYLFRGYLHFEEKDYASAYRDFLQYYQLDSLNNRFNYLLATLDFKFEKYKRGFSRYYKIMEDEFSDSSNYLTASPWDREVYRMMTMIHSDSVPEDECDYVNDYYQELHWGKRDKSYYIVKDYLDDFKTSDFAKRFYCYNQFKNQSWHWLDLENKPINNTLDRLIQKNPADNNLLFMKGELLYQQKKYDECIDVISKGLKNDSLYPYPYKTLAEAAYMLDEYESSLHYLQKGIELHPDYSLLYAYSGKLYNENLNQKRKAIEAYKMALEKFHEDEFSIYKSINMPINFPDLKKNDRTYDYKLALANIYDDIGQYDSAIIYLDDLIRRNPEKNALLERRGFIYVQKKEYDKAISDFNRIIIEYNRNYYTDANLSRTLFERGNAYYYKEFYKNAIQDYKGSLEFRPNSSIVISAMADCYRKMDKNDKAIKLYDEAIGLDKNNVWFYLKKSESLINQEEYMQGIKCISDAILIDSTFAEGYEKIGWIYNKIGNYRVGFHFSQKALSCNPNLIDASFNTGLSMIGLGYDEEAVELYKNIKSVCDKLGNISYKPYINDLKALIFNIKYKEVASKTLYEVFGVVVIDE